MLFYEAILSHNAIMNGRCCSDPKGKKKVFSFKLSCPCPLFIIICLATYLSLVATLDLTWLDSNLMNHFVNSLGLYHRGQETLILVTMCLALALPMPLASDSRSSVLFLCYSPLLCIVFAIMSWFTRVCVCGCTLLGPSPYQLLAPSFGFPRAFQFFFALLYW